MRALDAFCGAGGMSAGLAAAGWEVVGIDNRDQPRYPFEFVQGDVFELLPGMVGAFDLVVGGPTCNDHSALKTTYAQEHGTAWQVSAFRDLCVESGKPYVIENVPGAPLVEPIILCGSMFGLGADCFDGWRQLRRHRLFESNRALTPPGPCRHRGRSVGVYGGGDYGYSRPSTYRGGYQGTKDEKAQAMGITWMTREELNRAIPPAYGEHLGRQLMADLEA